MDEPIKQLQRIYSLFESVVHPLPLSCGKGCTECCTRNVTMTSLEGRWVLQNLDTPATQGLFHRTSKSNHLSRFQPSITLNQMADLAEAGEESPDDQSRSEGGICPLLDKEECTIYAVRPFMCRSMVSEIPCIALGYATVQPFILTVAHVLMQIIEHLDVNGFSGNLSDVFLELASTEKSRPDAADPSKTVERVTLPNRPLRRLMVPPEHRGKIQDLLKKLRSVA